MAWPTMKPLSLHVHMVLSELAVKCDATVPLVRSIVVDDIGVFPPRKMLASTVPEIPGMFVALSVNCTNSYDAHGGGHDGLSSGVNCQFANQSGNASKPG